jgi:iron complex outermembrane receptor protein
MSKLLYTIVFVFTFFASYGQKLVNISGRITDTKKQPVRGATIHLLNTNFNTLTDENGKFLLGEIPAGKYITAISAIGYVSKNEAVDLVRNSDQLLEFQLTDNIKQLDAVVVTAEKTETNIQSVPFSISSLSEKNIREYRLWKTEDLTAIIPNLYTGGPGDGRNVTGIRGIVSTSYDPAVTTMIDGVNQFTLILTFHSCLMLPG